MIRGPGERSQVEIDFELLKASHATLIDMRAAHSTPLADQVLTGADHQARILIPQTFGSPKWAELVFQCPSAHEGYKRGRPAERGLVMIGDRVHITEGHERIALYVLEHLMLGGTIRRIKTQPFSWLLPGASHPRIPDFLVELSDGRLVIIEVKAEMYLTRKREARFDDERRHAARAGVDFLVWTDRSFLTLPIRNLFTRLRSSRALQCSDAEIQTVPDFLADAGGQATLGALLASKIEPALVCRAVRTGYAFISLDEDLHVDSIASIYPITDGRRFLLDRGYHASNWWKAMQDRQARRGHGDASADSGGQR